MKVNILDKEGKIIEGVQLEFEKSVFGAKPNNTVLRQYLRVYQMNQRQGTSSTKTRSEVSGGGRKPWAQKGTGKARHGSTRSPIWVKGGISHGPKPKSWNLNLPKKIKQNAFRSALSHAVLKNKIVVIDKIDIRKPKTKKIVELVSTLKLGGKILFVLDKKDENVWKSIRNIKKAKAVIVDSLNVYDILNVDYIVVTKKTVEILNEKYKKL